MNHVYFMTNTYNTALYVGVTSNLHKRVSEHKNGTFKNSFTSQYNCNKLVYFEECSDINAAIAREKNIKNWKREWKDELVVTVNPDWRDLSDGWYD